MGPSVFHLGTIGDRGKDVFGGDEVSLYNCGQGASPKEVTLQFFPRNFLFRLEIHPVGAGHERQNNEEQQQGE